MTAKRRSRARVAAERVGTARGSSRPSFLSSPRGLFALIFASASIVRLGVAATTADLPIVRTPKLDSAEYVSWARRMAEGNFTWPAVSAHGPGYPLFLAGIFALGGSNWSAIVLQSLLGGLTAAFIAVLGSRWFGARVGLWSGLLYATLAPAVYVETNLLAEGLLLCVLTAALVVVSTERPATPRAFGGGALLGFAMLVRPTAALMFAAVVLALWRVARPRRVAVAAAIVGGAFVVLAPALIKNWSASRTLGIQGFGGLNFYIGNSPLHNGRPVFRLGAGWDALNSEAERAGLSDPAAQDRYYIRKTLDEITARPGAYLRLLGEKMLWLVQASEVRDSHSFYFFTSQSALLAILPTDDGARSARRDRHRRTRRPATPAAVARGVHDWRGAERRRPRRRYALPPAARPELRDPRRNWNRRADRCRLAARSPADRNDRGRRGRRGCRQPSLAGPAEHESVRRVGVHRQRADHGASPP